LFEQDHLLTIKVLLFLNLKTIKFMKNSRLFLGLTTLCLAVAGVVAARAKTASNHNVFTKVGSAGCKAVFSVRAIQPYTTGGNTTSPTIFTASGCSHAWRYSSLAGE
jgi:hypothetical protein